MHHPTDRIAHTTAFVIPVVELWLESEIAQWVHHEGSIYREIGESICFSSYMRFKHVVSVARIFLSGLYV